METNWHTWSTKQWLPKQKKITWIIHQFTTENMYCTGEKRQRETKRGMEKGRRRQEEGKCLIWACLYEYLNIVKMNINSTISEIIRKYWIFEYLLQPYYKCDVSVRQQQDALHISTSVMCLWDKNYMHCISLQAPCVYETITRCTADVYKCDVSMRQ